MKLVKALQLEFNSHKNASNAAYMEAYMKHLFSFLGIKATIRKTILKNVINTHKTEESHKAEEIALALYNFPEREYQYCAMELYARFKKKQYQENDIELIKHLIISKSHWDTVDFIAKHILGQFLNELPHLTQSVISSFSNSKNMWLNRSALLFQLGYKANTNADLLFSICTAHKTSKEFFIQKAIGWALREYSKTNASAVSTFVAKSNLKPLSSREAIRLIK